MSSEIPDFDEAILRALKSRKATQEWARDTVRAGLGSKLKLDDPDKSTQWKKKGEIIAKTQRNYAEVTRGGVINTQFGMGFAIRKSQVSETNSNPTPEKRQAFLLIESLLDELKTMPDTDATKEIRGAIEGDIKLLYDLTVTAGFGGRKANNNTSLGHTKVSRTTKRKNAPKAAAAASSSVETESDNDTREVRQKYAEGASLLMSLISAGIEPLAAIPNLPPVDLQMVSSSSAAAAAPVRVSSIPDPSLIARYKPRMDEQAGELFDEGQMIEVDLFSAPLKPLGFKPVSPAEMATAEADGMPPLVDLNAAEQTPSRTGSLAPPLRGLSNSSTSQLALPNGIKWCAHFGCESFAIDGSDFCATHAGTGGKTRRIKRCDSCQMRMLPRIDNLSHSKCSRCEILASAGLA